MPKYLEVNYMVNINSYMGVRLLINPDKSADIMLVLNVLAYMSDSDK